MTTATFLTLAVLAGAPDGSTPERSLLPDTAPALVGAPLLAEPMSRSALGAFRDGVNVRDLGELDPGMIAKADAEAAACPTCGPGADRERVGLVRTLALPVTQFEMLATPLADGRSMWTFAVRSPGSFRTRLHCAGLDLGDGSMIVWSEGKNGAVVRGSYTGRGSDDDGELWAAAVPGDTVFVEIVGHELPVFSIAEVVHMDHDQAAGAAGAAGDGGSNGNGVFSCHNDAMCYTDPDDDVARRATGQMNYVSGGGSYVCTGTLLNDSDGETYAPYFLTAYHCLHTETEANTLEVVWLWQKSACNGTLPDYDELPRSTGADYLESGPTDGENDFCFLRLDGLLPGGLAFAGWTTAHPENARAFHHPSGSWKRGTTLLAVGFCPWCLCLDSSDYDYYEMTDGLVEGGSSGGGIFNTSGQLFGQLFGRCGGVDDPDDMNCSNIDSYRAMYGEFEETYDDVDFYLETLGGTIWVDAAFPDGLPQNGGPSFPFNLISEGYAAGFDGAQLKIKAGAYPGAITMTKVLTLKAVNGTVTIGN
ncbi:MAG: serine protease [Phycisphaerae bacterium]|nr:serine protease [Phycisphaerae bacterium]